MAYVSQQMRVGYPNIFVVLIGFYGLFFLTNKLRDSAWGLVSAFALTGFMGFILGPILNRYLGMAGGALVLLSDLGQLFGVVPLNGPVAAACALMKLAGENAALQGGPGSFTPAFLDALYAGGDQ